MATMTLFAQLLETVFSMDSCWSSERKLMVKINVFF